MSNTRQTAEVSKVIKAYREEHGLTQKACAKSIGVSAGYMSCLEALPTNKITPSIYQQFMEIGLDLKAAVPSLIVDQERGKKRVFHGDMRVPLARKDPIKLLAQARDLVHSANEIITHKVKGWDDNIDIKKQEIADLDKFKADLLDQRAQMFDNIINIA